MNPLSTRRSRLIAAQTALVVLLSALLYIGLLKPSTPSPLSTGTVPGGPHAGNESAAGNNNPLQGPGQTATSPNAGNGGGTPPTVNRPPPAREPTSPGGDQYSSTVTALNAKLGVAAAGIP
jgi:hypothetical protein